MPAVKVTVRTAQWLLSEFILRIMSATNIQNSWQKEIINMSVLVTLEINIKPENMGDLTDFMKRDLHHTRSADGCNGLTVHANQDNPNNVVVVEDWDSREQYETYLGWRAERGDLEKLGSWIEEAPSIRFFDNLRL